MMQRFVWSDLSARERAEALARPALVAPGRLAERVADIIARVRDGGDAALRELSAEIDGVELGEIAVTAAEIDAAGQALTAAQREAIVAAADNICTFHREQLPARLDVDTMPGVRCERIARPIASVGLYVPAGTAPLPSTALMLGIPATLAGCPTRVLCSPPRKDGSVDPAVLFAARVAGVADVFRVGGAQAIAAMAYGTASVPKVEKVLGPGNPWVTEAKAQVDRDPAGAARDYPAGPSEVLVIADADANPEFVAADLLSQAEHGPDSQVLLVTTSAALGDAVAAAIDVFLVRLPRRAIIEASLMSSRVIVVDSIATAVEVSNAYAPEHLILQIADARGRLDSIEAAGSVFLGAWAPESVGDYCSGTNHVLPTAGFARRYSSLGVGDFMRSMTVQELSREGLERIGPIAETLAMLEGLDAHALAVSERRRVIAEGREP
jgi:histidinol dehydrogenase